MLVPAKYENRNYGIDAHVWVGKYRNLHNISHWHLEYELVACQAGMVQLMINGHCFPPVSYTHLTLPTNSLV